MPCHAQIILLFLIFSTGALCGSDVSGELKQLLKERIDAISTRDTVALTRICTRDYQVIGSAGEKMTLPELKQAVMQTETPVKLTTILSYQPFIAEDESMAFATFEIEEEVVLDKQDIVKNNLIITEIYKKDKSRWKIQLTHTSQKICLLPD
jgi:hypothetical protein